MTRIIAGLAKGRRLQVPPKGTRPTSDKVRGAIFSKLSSWDVVEGARVLDLFAGSGALALEALSRGATSAVMVEKAAGAAGVIRTNVATCGFEDQSMVVVADVVDYLGRPSTPSGFDLVFVDPPYSLSEDTVTVTLQKLVALVDIDATIVLERDARSPEPQIPPELALISRKSWGDTAAWYLKVAASEL